MHYLLLTTIIFLGAVQFADASPAFFGVDSNSNKRALQNDGSLDTFVSFQEFLGQVESASFEGFSSDVAAFEDIRSHIKKMYAGVTAQNVASFWLGGQHVDCIAIEEQPTVFHFGIQHIEEPPKSGSRLGANATTRPFDQEADSLLKHGLTDKFGNAISCPKHTIPMSRLTLERLTKFATLRHFFGRSPSGFDSTARPRAQTVPQAFEPKHKYAVAGQHVNNLGGSSAIELWNPVADFSLSQQWFVSQGQTVEGGWIVYPGHFRTTASVLFIYWTPDNYSSGCYNLECPGFVQTDHTWSFGVPLWSNYSTPTSRRGFGMEWQLVDGNWWLYMSPSGQPNTYTPVGYYPSSIYNGGLGHMSTYSELIEFGGEVARLVGNDWPPMGSGVVGTAGSTVAANQKMIFYLPSGQDSSQLSVWANLAPVRFDSPCYSGSVINYPSGSNWDTYLLYGGPGGNTATCGA